MDAVRPVCVTKSSMVTSKTSIISICFALTADYRYNDAMANDIIHEAVYEAFLRGRATQRIIQRHQVNLLIVNVEREEIVEWVKESNTQI